ncbi:MAG: MMPL family transporter [Candidatus Aenigmarchaeota archaeon]|nr:MMPL family transporter [Candidatus Aenigmarchaeota archaeon]
MDILKNLARFQYKYSSLIFMITVILTMAIGLGIQNIHLQTDINKELPQNLDVIKLQNKISDKFGGADTVMVLIKLDKNCKLENAPKDIRDPKVIRMLVGIENEIKKEPSVSSVQSAGSFFVYSEKVPDNIELIKQIFAKIPNSEMFFNKDYSSTLMIISADLGSSEEKINHFVSKIKGDIKSVEKPACIDITVTGNPPIRVVLMKMLEHDMIFTMGIAAIIILFLLILIKRSFTKGILVFTPLILGLTWTLGLMGWLNTPLSVATVGIGAMILGLGTEYGIFLVERYEEEREKGKNQKKALITALPSVGSGIIGSGTTTIVGFLALLLASMPMIRHLGETLALGIFCILFATVVVSPAIILIEERFIEKAEKFELKLLRRGLKHEKNN